MYDFRHERIAVPILVHRKRHPEGSMVHGARFELEGVRLVSIFRFVTTVLTTRTALVATIYVVTIYEEGGGRAKDRWRESGFS